MREYGFEGHQGLGAPLPIHRAVHFEILAVTYHQSLRGKNLLAFDGVNDGKVAFCGDDHQYEDRGCVGQTVHELVHLAQGVTQNPAVTLLVS
jgi:hypothetical protein